MLSELALLVARLRSASGRSLKDCTKAAKGADYNFKLALEALASCDGGIGPASEMAVFNNGLCFIWPTHSKVYAAGVTSRSDFVTDSDDFAKIRTEVTQMGCYENFREDLEHVVSKKALIFKEPIQISRSTEWTDLKLDATSFYMHMKKNDGAARAISFCSTNDLEPEVRHKLSVHVMAGKYKALNGDKGLLSSPFIYEPTTPVNDILAKCSKVALGWISLGDSYCVKIHNSDQGLVELDGERTQQVV